jgi:hypothetical protein
MAGKKSIRPAGGGPRSKNAWSWQALTLIGALLLAILGGAFPDLFPNLGGDESGKSDRKGSAGSRGKGSGGGSSSSSREERKRASKLSFDLSKTIERSAKAIKAQDWGKAEKHALRATKEAPESWQAWMQLGVTKRLGGGAAGVMPAVGAFTKAVELQELEQTKGGGGGGFAETHSYLASALSCTSMLATAKMHAFKVKRMTDR